MSNPMQAPKDYILPTSGNKIPLAYLPPGAHEALKSSAARYNDINRVKAFLRPLNLIPAHSVLTDGELACDERIIRAREAGRSAFVIAPAGMVNTRLRSSTAVRLAQEMYDRLSEEGQSRVGAKMRTVVKAGGGTQSFFGRLAMYYPKKEDDISKLVPPTPEEVALAIDQCGLRVDRVAKGMRFPLAMETQDGDLGITVAMGANLGAPVFGKPKKTADALRNAIQIAYGLEDVFTEAYRGDRVNGVATAYMALCESQPDYMCWTAKTKEDFYSIESVMKDKLRMYNIMPAGLKLYLSQVTQAAEMHAKNCLTDKKLRTAQRAGMAHGNAKRMVDAICAQLQRQMESYVKHAYLHCGDDAYVVTVVGNVYHLYNIDMSSFDLTQRKVIKDPVLEGLSVQLAAVCPVRAQLWKACMAMKKIVISGAATYYAEDGGSSGGVFQSEVNDVESDIFHQRLETEIRNLGEEVTEERIAAAVVRAGDSMGFVVKLENYKELAAKSLLEAMSRAPTKFLSFYLVPHMGTIKPAFDPERLFARIVYGGMYTKDDKEFKVNEAVRLASVLLSAGPSYGSDKWIGEYSGAYAIGCRAAVRLLHECDKEGLVPSGEIMKVAFEGQAYVNLEEAPESHSLRGLAVALRNRDHIWNDPLTAGVALRLIASDEEDQRYERPPIDPVSTTLDLGEDDWSNDFPGITDIPEETDVPMKAQTKRDTNPKTVKIVPRAKIPVTGPSHGRVPKGTPQKKITGKEPPKIVPRSAPRAKKVSLRDFVPPVDEEDAVYNDPEEDFRHAAEQERIDAEVAEEFKKAEDEIERNRARIGEFVEEDDAADDDEFFDAMDQDKLQDLWEDPNHS